MVAGLVPRHRTRALRPPFLRYALCPTGRRGVLRESPVTARHRALPPGRSFDRRGTLGEGSRASDITSPYGYGGPYAEGERDRLAGEFWPAFDRWTRSRGVVTVFTRLSLFAEQLLPFPNKPVEKALDVVRSLDHDEKQIWSDYHHKVRKNVNRATPGGRVHHRRHCGRTSR